MKLRKVLAIVLCVAMVLSTMSFSVFATEEPVALSDGEELQVADDKASAYWSSEADTTWYKETDDEGNEILEFTLTTAEQLAGLAELVDGGNTFEGKTIVLGNDINLWGEDESGNKLHFNPIGHSSNGKSFNGTFDGQGHTISNLYQQSDLDAWQYEGEYYGLFAYTNSATIQNLTIDGAYVSSGRNEAAAVVGNATDTTFSDITVSKSTMIVYNNSGAAVASECYGNCSFEDIEVTEDTVVGPLWGTYDARCGGIVGLVHAGNNVSFKDVTVACKIDGINDVASNYQYWLYRYCGMLIGHVDAVNGVADPTGYVTCENVNVTIGEWANYHYCEFDSLGQGSYNGPDEWKFARVEAGTGNNAIDLSACNHKEYESHNVLIPFNQLFGGGQGVKGLAEYEGVNVTNLAEDERTVAELWVASDVARSVLLESEGKFETLQAAIDAIGTREGEFVIKVLKDIEEDVTVTQYANQKITIEGDETDKPVIGGTIRVNGRTNAEEGEALTIKNLAFDADAVTQDSIVYIPAGNERYARNITIDSCDVVGTTDNAYTGVALLKEHTGGGSNFVITNTTVTGIHSLTQLKNVVGVTIEETDVIDCKNGVHLGNSNNVSVTDTTIETVGYGLRAGNDGNTGAMVIELSGNDINAGEQAIYLREGSTAANLTINSGKYIGGENFSAIESLENASIEILDGEYSSDVTDYLADGLIISVNGYGNYTPVADDAGTDADSAVATKIEVSLVPVEGNPNKYDVVLTANDNAEIHRFLSAELNIKLIPDEEDVTPISIKKIVGNKEYNIEVIDPDNNPSAIWGFHLGEATDTTVKEYSGSELTIATVELAGYGKGQLIIAPHDNNKVEAIQSVDNNVVKGYLVTNTEDGVLVINQTIHNVNLEVPTKDLTIEITFVNPIMDQIADYQDMTVTVEGKDIDTKTVKLGVSGDVQLVTSADGKVVQYVITLDDELTENNSYNITVTGAGYRTAEYRVTMTEDKTVYFWNDAKKDGMEETIEIGVSAPVKATFLAGDIAEDNIIDKYDLAAVVSYFGKYNLTDSDATYKYAKYDLNRDGNIDSEDIAYVLASFGY